MLKQAEVAKLSNLQLSVADSTAKNYVSVWGRFCSFCSEAGLVEMPFSSATAALFLSYLAESAKGL